MYHPDPDLKKKVARSFKRQRSEVYYLADNEELRQWSDRKKKKFKKATFNGYVFVK